MRAITKEMLKINYLKYHCDEFCCAIYQGQKVTNNGLPDANNLVSRGLLIPDLCPLCNAANETIEHLLRVCAALKLREVAKINVIDSHSFSFVDWIKANAKTSTLSNIHIPMGTLFVYLLWHQWIARNKVFEYSTYTHYVTCNFSEDEGSRILSSHCTKS